LKRYSNAQVYPQGEVATFKLTLCSEAQFNLQRDRCGRRSIQEPAGTIGSTRATGSRGGKAPAVRSSGDREGHAAFRLWPASGGMQWPYFGGAGVNPSRLRPGSGFGFGFGAFLTSFLPLSLLPMGASVTQKGRGGKGQKLNRSARVAGWSTAMPASTWKCRTTRGVAMQVTQISQSLAGQKLREPRHHRPYRRCGAGR